MDGKPVAAGNREQSLQPPSVEDRRLDGPTGGSRVLEGRAVDLSRAWHVVPEDVADSASARVVELAGNVDDAVVVVEYEVRTGRR